MDDVESKTGDLNKYGFDIKKRMFSPNAISFFKDLHMSHWSKGCREVDSV